MSTPAEIGETPIHQITYATLTEWITAATSYQHTDGAERLEMIGRRLTRLTNDYPNAEGRARAIIGPLYRTMHEAATDIRAALNTAERDVKTARRAAEAREQSQRRQAVEDEVTRLREQHAEQAEQERLDTASDMARRNGLIIEREPGDTDTWRIGAVDPHHPAIPSKYADPIRAAQVQRIRANRRTLLIPPGARGTFTHCEQWLQHHYGDAV